MPRLGSLWIDLESRPSRSHNPVMCTLLVPKYLMLDELRPAQGYDDPLISESDC